jgi:hypothetical protein
VGAVVGSFKAAVTRRVNQLRPGVGTRMWQRDYHDHIIRNDRAFDAIRDYIENNPANWDTDEHNADAVKPASMDQWLRSIIPADTGDACVAPTKIIAAPGDQL